jgi:hypothetical protein
MKRVFALAAVAALGFSGAAFAGDAMTGPAAMSDAEMDNVTAGAAAKDFAPGQLKKQPGALAVQGGARDFAPGQVKKGP